VYSDPYGVKTMRIRAKFASCCAACGGAIREGEEIEWEKGAPSRHATCPERSSGLRLIQGEGGPSTGMNTQNPSPIFPVSSPSTRSPEENVALVGTLAHVVEVKSPYALVHSTPSGVAKMAEAGLEVFPSKKGGDYYAVRIARQGANLGLVRPVSAQVVPEAPARAPVARTVNPVAGSVRMVLKGSDYIARETSVKRRNMDVRRFEVRKDGELVQEPYVVSFQSEDGEKAQCSCPDWIYRRRCCKHIQGCQAVFARARQTEIAIAN